MCPDSMLIALVADCDKLPARVSNAKILDYVQKFNKNGAFLLEEMFSKHEAMIVATTSFSSTLR